VTRTTPLSHNVKDLSGPLDEMKAEGGGDIPEAVREGLSDAVNKMRWSGSRRTAKLVVLVGDAPPKPGSEAECVAIAKRAAEAGIKVYPVKVTSATSRNDLSAFDDIAAAAGTRAVAVTFPALSDTRYVGADRKVVPVQTIPRPEAQLLVAPAADADEPGDAVLAHVLAAAINPQYADRVAPLARTLLAHEAPKADPEKRVGFPANTPPLRRISVKAQKP
ncbi:MAG: von Willebrand factor, type, partial [Phycisphaerales bacterium]|nr:von Willebrand factor, type [Phycisphaerales bacterium]